MSSRSFSYAVDVAGSIPALRAGDLQINGIEIGASHAEDDPFSPSNNASGSAIAKAAAINRMANATGVTRGESQMLTFSGTRIDEGTLDPLPLALTATTVMSSAQVTSYF